MYTSLRENLSTLRAWRRERFAHALFVPVAMTLVVASLVGAEWPSLSGFALRTAGAWMTVLALRFWDDLEDRQRDAQSHPERMLTQIVNVRPYMLIVEVLLLIAGLLILLAGGVAWVWLILVGALMVFYRLEGQTRRGGDFVILLKYPILVLVLGGSFLPISLAASALVLAAVCVDEVLQRRKSRRKLIRGGLLIMTLVTLLLCNSSKFAELIHALN